MPARGTLGAGRYEAPSWAFYGAASLAVVVAAVFFFGRSGFRKRAAKRT